MPARKARAIGFNHVALEVGDIEEALNAASKIGDDTLQRKATGAVRPESFTHGSSAQRQRWFQRGYASGQRDACDTFTADPL
jgi:predicted metalloprotease